MDGSSAGVEDGLGLSGGEDRQGPRIERENKRRGATIVDGKTGFRRSGPVD